MSETLKAPAEPLIVLILGGVTTAARALTKYLLAKKEGRANFVRIGQLADAQSLKKLMSVDLAARFSVNPPTTYLDKTFRDLLGTDKRLEYVQANLGNAQRHLELFTPPQDWNGSKTGWTRFDVVYDLTGETAFDKPELLQISNTYQLALSLASSAAAMAQDSRPKSYVRLTFPFYEMKSVPSSSQGHTETADLRPDGERGRWWHEAIRGIGRIPGLNFGVIRSAAWYGEGIWEEQVVPRLVVGQVYKYLNEEMKFLHNSDLRINTVHIDDVAQALYLLSLYLLSTPGETVIPQSAVKLPFTFIPPPSSTFSIGTSKKSIMSDMWKTVDSVVPDTEEVKVPLFNVADDGDSTQESLAKAVAQVWGIRYGFVNSTIATLVQQFAKSEFSEMVEDVNEKHVEAWSNMLAASKPPITSTPITPFLDEHAFRKHSICLDGSKVKRLLRLKLAVPKVDDMVLRRIVEGFQEDGLWPKS